MHLQKIILTQFKNYKKSNLSFSPQFNCLVGKNGMGKTNLLDAIYYLCMCKSHFTTSDTNVVQHSEDFFRLEGHFELNGKVEKIVAKVLPRKQKTMERNDVTYNKLADHIGLLPIVIIAPDDTIIAREGSEERRRFLDTTLCQLDATYLSALIQYNRLLRQRNALLKQLASINQYDATMIQVYNDQMIIPANILFQKRQAWIAQLLPLFKQYYQQISNDNEQVTIRYKSQLESDTPIQSLMESSMEKDRILQRTTIGIHKDDLRFMLNEYDLKKFASQGQLKSFILALKLAQYELLRQHKGISPILLLDDIFDKLDHNRVLQLLELLLQQNFGQVFITDTDEHRLANITDKLQVDYRQFIVENGAVL